MNLILRHAIALVNHAKQLSISLTESFDQKYWQKKSELSDLKQERLAEIGLPETVKLLV